MIIEVFQITLVGSQLVHADLNRLFNLYVYEYVHVHMSTYNSNSKPHNMDKQFMHSSLYEKCGNYKLKEAVCF